jgi:hypothetical protein
MIQVAQENGVGGKWGIFEQFNLASPAGVVVSRVEVAVEEGNAGEWVASVGDGGLQDVVVYDGVVADGVFWEAGRNDGQNAPRGAAVTVEAYVVAGKVRTEFGSVVVRARSDVLDAGDVMGQGQSLKGVDDRLLTPRQTARLVEAEGVEVACDKRGDRNPGKGSTGRQI